MCPGILFHEREELLLYFVPALQAAPQPIRADHMQVLALLCLAHFLCACRDNMSACYHEVAEWGLLSLLGRSHTPCLQTRILLTTWQNLLSTRFLFFNYFLILSLPCRQPEACLPGLPINLGFGTSHGKRSLRSPC